MRIDGPVPFHGQVVWLTDANGWTRLGPPTTPADQDNAATGFVPPSTAETGLASVVLRVADWTACRSLADADGSWSTTRLLIVAAWGRFLWSGRASNRGVLDVDSVDDVVSPNSEARVRCDR